MRVFITACIVIPIAIWYTIQSFKIDNTKKQSNVEKDLIAIGACATMKAKFTEGNMDIIPGTMCQLYAFEDHLEIHVIEGVPRAYSYLYDDISDVQIVNSYQPLIHPRSTVNTICFRVGSDNTFFYPGALISEYDYNKSAKSVTDLYTFVTDKLKSKESQ